MVLLRREGTPLRNCSAQISLFIDYIPPLSLLLLYDQGLHFESLDKGSLCWGMEERGSMAKHWQT
jgi:hypothetical protein